MQEGGGGGWCERVLSVRRRGINGVHGISPRGVINGGMNEREVRRRDACVPVSAYSALANDTARRPAYAAVPHSDPITALLIIT